MRGVQPLDHTISLEGGTQESMTFADQALSADSLELRNALARAIGALRNACVGAANSTAELLGGEDPTGFAEEVKALAYAHEKELAAELAKYKETRDNRLSGIVDEKGDAQSDPNRGGEDFDFWSRQSDLWSGVFAEQHTGLLQMVRAQEAELRHGKRRISSLESELAALKSDRTVAAAATAMGVPERQLSRSIGEKEASEWKKRLDRMRADYERRLSLIREKEMALEAAGQRLQARATELDSERDRLKARAMALSEEASGLK